jgi:hypothetical protein
VAKQIVEEPEGKGEGRRRHYGDKREMGNWVRIKSKGGKVIGERSQREIGHMNREGVTAPNK